MVFGVKSRRLARSAASARRAIRLVSPVGLPVVVPRASVGGSVTCGLPVAPPTAPVGVTVEGSTLLAGVGEGDETGVGVGVGDELGEVKKQPFAVVHGGVGCVGGVGDAQFCSSPQFGEGIGEGLGLGVQFPTTTPETS